MSENGEDGEESHNDQGAYGAADRKETDHADFCQVDACQEMSQCPGVHETFGVDVDVVDEEEVVSVRLIDKVKAHKSKAENERGNAGIAQS